LQRNGYRRANRDGFRMVSGRKKFNETALSLIRRCVYALGAGSCLHQRFIPPLKPPFKIPADHHDIRRRMPRAGARAIG
jgi:hypothetical protein